MLDICTQLQFLLCPSPLSCTFHYTSLNTMRDKRLPGQFCLSFWSKLFFFIATVCLSYRRDEVWFHYLCVFNSLQLAVFPHLLDKSIDFVSECSFYLQSNTKWKWLWCVFFSPKFPYYKMPQKMPLCASIGMFTTQKHNPHLIFTMTY